MASSPREKYAGITRHDAQDGLIFLAALVVLPFLPDRAIDPLGVFNPFAFWRLLLVMMGLSAAGYWAARLMGARWCLWRAAGRSTRCCCKSPSAR